MKIKYLIFFTVAITFVAAVSYHFGGSMRGRNPKQSLVRPSAKTDLSDSPARSNSDTMCRDQNATYNPSQMVTKSVEAVKSGPKQTGNEQIAASTTSAAVSKRIEEIEADFERRKQKIEEYYADRFRILRENAEIALKKLNYADKTAYANFIEQLNNTTSTSYGYTSITGRISPYGNVSADGFRTETIKTRVVGKPAAAYELKVCQLNKAAEDIISEYKLDCEHFERQRACALSDLEKEKKLALASISYQASRESVQPIPPKAPGTVTGILSSDGAPLTIINGKVLSEGQSINGVKVIKISRDSVEFDKVSTRWSQKVNESPSSNWP